MHLHRSYGGRSYLISYMAVVYDGQTFCRRAPRHRLHGARSVSRDVLAQRARPADFRTWSTGRPARVRPTPARGRATTSSAGAFPTTLYRWRLQAAPTSAPLLKEKRHTSRINQVALIALSPGDHRWSPSASSCTPRTRSGACRAEERLHRQRVARAQDAALAGAHVRRDAADRARRSTREATPVPRDHRARERAADAA